MDVTLIRLGRDAPGAESETPKDPECALCRDGERLTFVVIGHVDTAVCVDSQRCVMRALGAGVRS